MQVRVTTVSKTDYANWRTCPGYAWAMMHHPHLAPADDASTRRRELDGRQVEALVRRAYPGAVSIDLDDPDASAALSAEVLASGAAAIFQPTVISGRGLLARADLLLREADAWHLVEIKSSAADPRKPRSLVKKYLPDAAFQTLAFREAGVPITRTSLLHIDKRYRRNGSLDERGMLALTDITAQVTAHLGALERELEGVITALQDSDHPTPCECHRTTRSNRCDLFAHFHPDIPETGTVYHITGIHRNALLPALDRGIIAMVDWPEDLPLNPKQRRQVELARSEREHVDHAAIAAFLGKLRAPLWFLDYETFQEPVPRWTGYAPHQQIPFQYSLHSIAPGTGRSHHAYLHTARGADPVPDLLARLSQDLGPDGSVLVWNKAFEQARNEEMAELQPAYAAFLHGVNRRMVDLADVVKEGWWAHPSFKGSWGLKTVLPVVAPELAYDQLEIGDGGTASERWVQAMIDDEATMPAAERRAVLAALDAYCHQDSLALVRIWEYLLDTVTR